MGKIISRCCKLIKYRNKQSNQETPGNEIIHVPNYIPEEKQFA
jgi:hypothetical protein